MMGERPPRGAQSDGGRDEDEGFMSDGDEHDTPAEGDGSDDEDFVKVRSSSPPVRIERPVSSVPMRRTRSASPHIIMPLSTDLARLLLDDEARENAVSDIGDEPGPEDDDGEQESAAESEASSVSQGASLPVPPPKPDFKPVKFIEPPAGSIWRYDLRLSDWVTRLPDGKWMSYALYEDRILSDPSSVNLPKPPPEPTSSGHWQYNHKYGDYVQRQPDGRFLGYREYQQRGKARSTTPASFSVIDKPKRFYTPGRIFKINWAEPPAGEEKLVPRAKWFVVVRRRLHHALCFAITTGGGSVNGNGNGNGKSRAGGKGGGNVNAGQRGRAKDYVVLYPSGFLPPAPDDDEGIERPAVGVIIEDAEQCISPQARLDCARIYTVEFDVAVVKIGRIDTKDFDKLEEYYKECVQ